MGAAGPRPHSFEALMAVLSRARGRPESTHRPSAQDRRSMAGWSVARAGGALTTARWALAWLRPTQEPTHPLPVAQFETPPTRSPRCTLPGQAQRRERQDIPGQRGARRSAHGGAAQGVRVAGGAGEEGLAWPGLDWTGWLVLFILGPVAKRGRGAWHGLQTTMQPMGGAVGAAALPGALGAASLSGKPPSHQRPHCHARGPRSPCQPTIAPPGHPAGLA